MCIRDRLLPVPPSPWPLICAATFTCIFMAVICLAQALRCCSFSDGGGSGPRRRSWWARASLSQAAARRCTSPWLGRAALPAGAAGVPGSAGG
eukprot:9264878-Pyramimonas_sp.AAC.1